GISHFGPAMATLVNLHALQPASDRWRQDAARLRAATVAAQAANSEALWRDRIAVEAFRGREGAIAAMNDYACALTLRYLDAVEADVAKLTPAFLRATYLEATDPELGATIPLNAVMIATFFLAGLDTSFRIRRWFGEHAVDWSRAMVLICGRQGRPTSGVTWTSNSVCQMILAASDRRLALDRLYIAPHAPPFKLTGPDDLTTARAAEPGLRRLWAYTRAIGDLGATMFDGYPRYAADSYVAPVLTEETTALSEMPQIGGPDDMRAMVTRMRLVLEDPRQLLSGCVVDYAAEQLRQTGNDVAQVVVPGLDGYDYAGALR
ncbi:DUF5624 domain-containing protein, partial [uncultured Sphingomonas sp.]|uniref:DUF5624 domain-containing protein n=1 Tax=uncultured Sphingomonas sp. TaxID=158754 RepID=UPI0035CB6DC5